MNIEKTTYIDYIGTLSEVSGVKITTFCELCKALSARMDFFASMGCSVSDHGLEYVMYTPAADEEIEAIFAKRLGGTAVTREEVIAAARAVQLGAVYFLTGGEALGKD